ncbi:MAG: hypothetical protein GF334_05945 [Candidatus Altiarchaeales archaeon]|nr:hypothetical protein [Candidatus Altiarchaeales archaeon]
MIKKILSKLNPFKPKKSQVKLEIMASKVEEFEKAKTQMNTKIHDLEDKTQHMDETITQTLDLTSQNQVRLENIEENMGRIVELTEHMIKNKKQSEKKEE